MDITSPTVDPSQADGPTATRSQQQKAAAVQRQVAARKQRYLACAFPKLHVVAVSVQLSLVHGLLIRLTEDERAEALCSALRVSARAQNRKQTSLSELMMLIEFAPLIFGTAGLLAIFLFSQWQS